MTQPDAPRSPSSRRARRSPPLWWMAALWTAVVAVGGSWLILRQLDELRLDQVEASGHRLNSLQNTLEVTFQQLSALPRALGRETAIQRFLQSNVVEGSASVTEADRPRLSRELLARPEVRQMSQALKDLTRDFQLNEIFLLDRFGTALADSNYDAPPTPIGGNYRTRSYYTESLDLGVGTQFAVGRVTRIPGFYFAGRVDQDGQTVGVLIIKQEPRSMSRLFDDEHGKLFVTDRHGVVVMGNQPGWVLRHAPLRGAMTLSPEAQTKLYHQRVESLGWSRGSLTLGARHIDTVTIDGRTYLAAAQPFMGDTYTAWVLAPLQGEAALVAAGSAASALVLVLGYWVLAMIAQRNRRLASLDHARQELQDMAHALPLAVFCYLRDARGQGSFTFVSHTVEQLLGVDVATIEQDPTLPWRLAGLPDLTPPTVPIEISVKVHQRTRWLQCHSTPSPQPDGSTTYNGYWLDITAQKEQQARSHAVFYSAPNAYLFIDPDLGVQRANPAAVAMFHAESERALLGLKPWLPPLSSPVQANGRPAQELALELFESARQNGHARTYEWRHTTLDGQGFDCEVVIIPFMHDGQQLYCGVVQDITARKQAEAFTQAAQQAAEAATQAKSRFLANMSHEIRTPMNAVLGMTHLALMDNDMPAQARNYVEKAHRAASNLLQIINDILDVSKIESGKLTLETTDFQLENVVSQMAEVLGVRAEEKQLELLFTAAPDIPTALIGDPMRLGQILVNLGTNAIKFTERGEIVIGCEVQALQAQSVTLRFWVRDTGIGMSREQIDRLFQPFTQADSSTTRQYGGTGLGLTICRELVTLMNGRIWVDSAPGQGTTVHFTAELGLQAQQSPARRALLARELRGKRLLLVDDHPAARDILGEMSRRLGLDVDVAPSGTAALERMRQAASAGAPHDVLLTDWKMPEMDGIAFARAALALPPELRPCVLLVTAFAREEALRAAADVPLAGVLNKPVTPSSLLDALTLALGHDPATAEPPRASGKVLENAQRHLAGARVLLVEDQPMNQELACDLLTRAGLHVVTASDGREALDKLDAEGPFDGVLMDCQMPVMDGYTATRHIREQARWQHLPVIAMTASAMASDRERVLAHGMNDHITKPLDLNQMFAIMARWITPARPALSAPADKAGETDLPPCANLDTRDGLSRCMNHPDLYKRLLKGFDKTQAGAAAQIEQALARHDYESALQTAHSLKGLAGNIGAQQLARAADALENACLRADPDETVLHATATRTALQAVLADIQTLLLPTDVAPGDHGPLPDAAQLEPWWSQLAQLIDDEDAQAPQTLRDLLAQHPGLAGAAPVVALNKALALYDFDAASSALAAWRQSVATPA